MSVGKPRVKNQMALEYNFTGIRIIDQGLTPVDWSLKVNLSGTKKKSKSADDKANYIYKKIYFWLETNLQSTIMVDATDESDLYISSLSSNISLHCPGKATDDLLIRLLHSKLTSLSDGSLDIGEMTLKGSDTTLKYTFDTSDGDYNLPEKTSDYITCGTVRSEDPWWTKDDGFCFDFFKPKDNTDSDEEVYGEIFDPMAEFHSIMKDIDEISIVRSEAPIVVLEKWQPKIV